MIKIAIKDKSKKLNDPYYLLTYEYMIGDADGNTDEEVSLSLDNPYIERYVTLINKLKPNKGHWGLILGTDTLKKNHKEGHITEEEYKFLKKLMFEDWDNTDNTDNTDEDEFSYEFYDGVQGDTEYGFCCFQGATLEYVDEYGDKHDTYFVED